MHSAESTPAPPSPRNKPCNNYFLLQVFVRFSVGDKEIYYVTKHSTETGDYSFELDVNEAATDFGSLSDSYAMVGHYRSVTFVFNIELKVCSCLLLILSHTAIILFL